MQPLRIRPKVEAAPGDAIDLLLACHARIRHFTAMAGKLADARVDGEVAPSMIADAARSLSRYFGIALPLHVADEDVSIALRVDGRPMPTEVRQALDAMMVEHAAIDRLLEDLLPRWRRVAEAPEALEDERVALAKSTPPLASFMESHLAREEAVIFPWLRRTLGAEGLALLADEMRARRVDTWIPEPLPATGTEGAR
jgi:hemerythrin-like domain-containing protein